MASIDLSVIDDDREQIADIKRRLMALDPNEAAFIRDCMIDLARATATALSNVQDKIREAASKE